MASGKISHLDEQEISKKYPNIYNSLIPLLRRSPSKQLDAYLETVAFNKRISDTQAQAHCHFITLDYSKRPRVNDFVRFICNKVTDFAIPRSEVKSAIEKANEISSAAPIAKLNTKAKNLFLHFQKSGEGGEVILSLLAETFLRIPQLFTKMVLKTSSSMHVHGCDGIHVGINEANDRLALYWGESKLHKDVSSAICKCFESLAPFLLDVGGSYASQERDLQLMRDGIDLNDNQLEKALKHYLDPDDPLFKKLEFCGLCLVGFDSEAYPTEPNSKELQQVKSDIEKTFEDWKVKIQKQVIQKKIASFKMEVFCLPFPNVADFRIAFQKELGITH